MEKYYKINIFPVKSTFLLKKLLKSWFKESFLVWPSFTALFHFCGLSIYVEKKKWFHRISLRNDSWQCLPRTVWKRTIKRDHYFYGKFNIFFAKSTSLLKKLLKSWFHGNFLSVIAFYAIYFSTLWHCNMLISRKFLSRIRKMRSK